MFLSLVVQLLSMSDSATPWIAACQASLSFTVHKVQAYTICMASQSMWQNEKSFCGMLCKRFGIEENLRKLLVSFFLLFLPFLFSLSLTYQYTLTHKDSHHSMSFQKEH